MRALVIAGGLLVLLSGGLQAQEVGFIEVQGLDGGPASVFLYSDLWAEPRYRTLADGPVLFEVPAGAYSLEVRQDGFQSFTQEVTVLADEVSIIRPVLWPILTEVRIVHLLPAEVPFQIGDQSGFTPATVWVPAGERVMLVDNAPFCIDVLRDTTAYIRIRAGDLEQIRGGSECDVPSDHPLLRVHPPVPRSVEFPSVDEDLRGTRVTVWMFVGEDGRVIPDSTRLEPPTRSKKVNEQLIRAAAGWVFDPATRLGQPVAAWFSFTQDFGR